MLLLLQIFCLNCILKQLAMQISQWMNQMHRMYHKDITVNKTAFDHHVWASVSLPGTFEMPAVPACPGGCLVDKPWLHLPWSTRVGLQAARPFALLAAKTWCPGDTVNIREMSPSSLPVSEAKSSVFALDDAIFEMIYLIIPVVRLKISSRSSENY